MAPRDASTLNSSKASTSGAEKPAHDVFAGAMARSASQATIHPIDTLKVRSQAVKRSGGGSSGGFTSRLFRVNAASVSRGGQWQLLASEVSSLYKGVLGAATGAGIIIGAYFACYSTCKRALRQHRPDMSEASLAFVSGATAAVGSSVVKVPIAVCIRSVQAGVYPNAIQAAKSITAAAGFRGLFTGFVPTLLEDAPDMAVKFAVYETLQALCRRLHGRQPTTLEDLFMGGVAGAAAAAATTPLDVVKTRMMTTASSRPTIARAVRSVLEEGQGWRAFFRGVGPRALSNGLNSAIFFCFFEAIRRVLQKQLAEAQLQRAVDLQLLHERQAAAAAASGGAGGAAPLASLTAAAAARGLARARRQHQQHGGGARLACLSLALPLRQRG